MNNTEINRNETISEERILAKNSRGTMGLFEALLYGEPVYGIEHFRFGWKGVFSHDETIKDLVQKALTANGLKYDNTNRQTEFKEWEGHKDVSMKRFLFCQYESCSVQTIVNKRIGVNNRELEEYGIYDMRKENIYLQGGMNEYGLERLTVCDRELVLLSSGGDYSIIDYKEPLYDMLSNRAYCGVASGEDRHEVFLYGNKHNSKKLARFVLLYNSFFGRFGNAERFLESIPELEEELGMDTVTDAKGNVRRVPCYHAAHIMAKPWNCCDNNLMWMHRDTNRQMYSFSEYFREPYGMLSVVYNDDGKDVILIEFSFSSGSGMRVHYWCKTPEAYANLQREILGRKYTKEDGTTISGLFAGKRLLVRGEEIDMPLQSFKKKSGQDPKDVITEEYVKTHARDYVLQCERLTRLWQTNRDMFVEWKNDRSVESTIHQVLPLVGGMVSTGI